MFMFRSERKEIAARNVNANTAPATKQLPYVTQVDHELNNLAGSQRLRKGESVAILSPEIPSATLVGWGIRIHVYEFGREISVPATRMNRIDAAPEARWLQYPRQIRMRVLCTNQSPR